MHGGGVPGRYRWKRSASTDVEASSYLQAREGACGVRVPSGLQAVHVEATASSESTSARSLTRDRLLTPLGGLVIAVVLSVVVFWLPLFALVW